MAFALPMRARLLLVVAVLAVLVALAITEPGGAAAPTCASFRSQAAAQDYLIANGGGPGAKSSELDDDRDGVACEGLVGPYKGFATIRYSRAKRFFFGAVSMPPDALVGGFACLEGNRHFADGPRLLSIYLVQPGADRKIVGEVGAAASPAGGRLVWKAERATIPDGLYYAEFEARIPLSPYGGNDCPGFRSRPAVLPAPDPRP